METTTHTAPTVDLDRPVRQSFPAYGVAVLATTIKGETGIWLHGDHGWYPDGKWGHNEFPHDHIAEWKSIPNDQVEARRP